MALKLLGVIVVLATASVSLVAHAQEYDIDLSLATSSLYVVLQFSVDYSASQGTFSLNGGGIVCTPNVSLGATSSFNDTAPVLRAVFTSDQGIGGGLLATCVLSETTREPTADQFTVTIDNWQGDGAVPPTVAISRIAIHE